MDDADVGAVLNRLAVIIETLDFVHAALTSRKARVERLAGALFGDAIEVVYACGADRGTLDELAIAKAITWAEGLVDAVDRRFR